MDEILIEEKKYVSSKQAAKATGYAKDYIGQLCREGRVPARLVGRSWYVLESALHDHRFGNPKDEPAEAEKSASTTQQPTWESPRYETFDAEELPVVNHLHKLEEEGPQEPLSEDVNETAQRLQETWQAWFDRFDTAPTQEAPTQPVGAESVGVAAEAPVEMALEEPQIEDVEEEVPVRAIHHQPYQPAPREFLPSVQHSVSDTDDDKELIQEERQETGRGRRLVLAIQAAGIVIAIIAVSLATLGSGYLDKYIISNSQVGLIAGVALYNK